MKIDSATLLGGDLNGLVLSRGSLIAVPQKGQLAISSTLSLQRYDGTAWVDVAVTRDQLYDFTAFTFTTPLVGNVAPTLAQIRTQQGAGLPWSSNTAWFNVAAGIQKWQVPIKGVYEIVATSPGLAHLRAARVTLRVTLGKGDLLSILPGQQGTTNQAGCGATWVSSSVLGLLAVAGAPGGFSAGYTPSSGEPQVSLISPGTGLGGNYGGYSNSFQGYGQSGSGGAGYQGDGTAPGGYGFGPRSFLNGGAGGQADAYSGSTHTQYTTGGFGGGGGGYSNGYGGGSGYTGGKGYGWDGSAGGAAASGGTSYAISAGTVTNRSAALLSAGSYGTVKITLVQAIYT